MTAKKNLQQQKHDMPDGKKPLLGRSCFTITMPAERSDFSYNSVRMYIKKIVFISGLSYYSPLFSSISFTISALNDKRVVSIAEKKSLSAFSTLIIAFCNVSAPVFVN